MFKKSLIILGLIATFFVNNTCYGAVDEETSETLKAGTTVINLKSNSVRYDTEKDQFTATGNVIIDVEGQNTTIESDEVIFDQVSQQIISQKNVKINKHGTVILGDYAKFDLTSNTAIISNPDADLVRIKIEAETAEIVAKDVELHKGRAIINDKDMIIHLSKGSFGRNSSNMIIKADEEVNPSLKYDIRAKEIVIDEYDYYNIITLKNASIKVNRIPIAKVPVMQLTTDGETNRVETMLPELGHEQDLGMYFGHGHVFHVYQGNTLKLLPIIAWGEGGAGYGGMGRYMSRTNRTEVLYSTLRNKVIIKGEQDLNFISPDTYLQYSTNTYVDNGFFGRQKPQYLVEVVDNRKITEAYNFGFHLRSSGGYAEEPNNYSTTKFQLQGTLGNIMPLLGYKNYLNLGVSSNFSISAYGTGDTYGVVRIGPTLSGIMGPFTLWSAYYQGAVYGETPFLYDRYLYGKSNVMLMGTYRVCKYLTVGYSTSLNLTKDNWSNELVTENQIFVWIGPDELKFKIGYDVERELLTTDFHFLVGSETSAFEFEKLRVQQK